MSRMSKMSRMRRMSRMSKMSRMSREGRMRRDPLSQSGGVTVPNLIHGVRFLTDPQVVLVLIIWCVRSISD
jgi:hypothetical protein